MPAVKHFQIKVYDQDGTTQLKTLTTDAPSDGSMHVKNSPTFTTRINGGQGELVLDLKTRFDNFEEGTTVNFMNIVKVYAVVIDTALKTQSITLIYTGVVSRYEPYIESGNEGVRVTCLGLVSLLTFSYYGSPTDYSVAHSGKDPEFIAKDVIDKFNAVYGGSLLGYSGTTSTVGTSVSYTFTQQKWFDALKKAGELAGTDWWWAVREDEKLYFKAKPGAATHFFTIGKDIESLSCPKDSEQVVNEVILTRSGGSITTYSDATSQTTFGTGSSATGKRTKLITDSNIADATTADQRGNKELADQKDQKITATLVVDSNYAIESVHVGDTCKVRNFRSASTFFSDNMLIVSVEYRGDTVRLELESPTTDFGLELAAFVE